MMEDVLSYHCANAVSISRYCWSYIPQRDKIQRHINKNRGQGDQRNVAMESWRSCSHHPHPEFCFFVLFLLFSYFFTERVDLLLKH